MGNIENRDFLSEIQNMSVEFLCEHGVIDRMAKDIFDYEYDDEEEMDEMVSLFNEEVEDDEFDDFDDCEPEYLDNITPIALKKKMIDQVKEG